ARRRPARWLQVAAVATGAVLVGGGGYALGAAGGDAPAAPPIALQGQAVGTEATVEGLAGADAGTARSMIAPGFGWRTTFTGEGLPTEPGEARAWAFDATSAATAEAARRAAEVLGVPGEPRAEWGQWVVGANDGTGASVTIGGDGTANLWFYDRARDPSVCQAGLPEELDGGAAEGAGPAAGTGDATGEPAVAPDMSILPVPAPEPVPEPAPADPSVCDPAATPTGDAAVAAARDLLDRLGVDTAGYELTVAEETGVPGLVNVQATQVVDGTQTGVAWTVGLAGDGVQSASGPLASLVELGTYDVVSATDAVERLGDPRFGASFGGVSPLARTAAAGAGTEDVVGSMPAEPQPAPAEPTVPPVPAPGSPIAWPVQQVTLVDARLGVTLLTTPDGATVLVPAWELADADGQTWSVIAVAQDQLDLSPVD
ncbi:hypothetical protein, partial [Cellulomonas shaoxiangyii]